MCKVYLVTQFVYTRLFSAPLMWCRHSHSSFNDQGVSFSAAVFGFHTNTQLFSRAYWNIHTKKYVIQKYALISHLINVYIYNAINESSHHMLFHIDRCTSTIQHKYTLICNHFILFICSSFQFCRISLKIQRKKKSMYDSSASVIAAYLWICCWCESLMCRLRRFGCEFISKIICCCFFFANFREHCLYI